jgi:predicted RNase H-like HicB family nuclease
VKDKFRLVVEKGRHGLWYVTSPDIKGLLVVGKTRGNALRWTGGALQDLERAARRKASVSSNEGTSK